MHNIIRTAPAVFAHNYYKLKICDLGHCEMRIFFGDVSEAKTLVVTILLKTDVTT